jgi:hypothetical protein
MKKTKCEHINPNEQIFNDSSKKKHYSKQIMGVNTEDFLFVFVILFIGTILIISFVYCCKFIRKPTFSDPHQHIIRDDEHSTNQAYMIRFQPIK